MNGLAAKKTIIKNKNNTLLIPGMINSMWARPIMRTCNKTMTNFMICIMIPTPAAKTAEAVSRCQLT
jgi:hypothetical protein